VKELRREKLKGSEREIFKTARQIGRINLDECIEVNLIIRHNPTGGGLPTIDELADMKPNQHLTHEEYEDKFSSDSSDIANVKDFAQDFRLNVLDTDKLKRTVKLSGTIRRMNSAFNVELMLFEHRGGICRGHLDPISLPVKLSGVVESVLGLDTWQVVRPHLKESAPLTDGNKQSTESDYFYPNEVARLYNFPSDLDGSGQCVGILEFGGGYVEDSLKTYFNKFLNMKMPEITSISVDGGGNNPGVNPSVDVEVMLDIQIVGAVAPGAKIAVYFTPDISKDPYIKYGNKYIIDAFNTAINDKQNKPSVISISWGGPEIEWTENEMNLFNQLVIEAGIKGITVCVSSGDNGSSESFQAGYSTAVAIVDYPASSPGVLSCGGTRLIADKGQIKKETVWNLLATLFIYKQKGQSTFKNGGSSGGGVSLMNPLPSYQKSAQVAIATSNRLIITVENDQAKKISYKGRGVPDVAGNGSPASGYKFLENNKSKIDTVGGTSAVAPLWAALIASINQGIGHGIGFMNKVLYDLQLVQQAEILHQITYGTNGAYEANVGWLWNACTGLGTPDGTKIYMAIKDYIDKNKN
jgi:kumamolisin